MGKPTAKMNKKARSKDAAGLWLEAHFGWQPAVDDVGAAVNTMQKADFGKKHVRIHVRNDFSSSWRINDISGPGTGTFERHTEEGKAVVTMAADIRVSNPNAYLANQMGFVNPSSVAWEAVPYSFVVDWFANVGQCLSAMTDFVGLDVTSPRTTTFQSVSYGKSGFYRHLPGPSGIATSTHSQSWRGWDVLRQTGIAGPTLELKPFKGFSPVRGATAISLLLQHF